MQQTIRPDPRRWFSPEHLTPAFYEVLGWFLGDSADHDRKYCVDLVHLTAFLRSTQPEVDTTAVDNAAFAPEGKAYFIRRVGTDGFKISHQPTINE